jgi:hypothetical protein
MPKNSDQFPWKVAGLLYFAAWAPAVLFLQAYFWDDWMIYFSMSASERRTYWLGEGFPPYVHAVIEFLLRNNPIAFHLLSLAIYFAVGVLIFHILKRLQIWSPSVNQRITLFSLVLPINSARAAMIILPYSISVLLFFVAWLMLLSKRKITVAASFIVFFFSFYTTSVIPFFTLPILGFVFLEWNRQKRFTKMVWIKASMILFAPAYYLIVSRLIWKPSTNRTDYFTPQLNGLIRAALLVLASFVIGLFIIRKAMKKHLPFESALLVSLGMIAISFGSVAYFAAGRLVDLSEWLQFLVPRSSSWDSRSQLLHGLGISLVLVGLVGEINSYAKKLSYRALMSFCILLNFTFMTGYYVDYLKQESILHSFSAANLEDNSVLMIRDNTDQFSARGRNLRSYEWEGMILKATGKKVKAVDEAFVFCSSDSAVPNVLVEMNPGRGRLATLVKRDAGILVSYTQINPC